MYKQSAYVLALFLGSSKAINKAPESYNYFATGMNGDEDLGEDITMKGDKFHYNQALVQTPPNQPSGEPEPIKDVREFKTEGLSEPEQVHYLKPRITEGQHTTFYTQMVQLNKDEEKNVHEPEQVHILEPIAYNVESNDKSNYPDIRTAFYVQYDEKNGLWRESNLLQDDGEAIGKAALGTEVHAAATNASEGIPHRRAESAALQVDPISPGHYDPWVYEFSRENMGTYPQHVQKKKHDIGEKGIEENVHYWTND